MKVVYIVIKRVLNFVPLRRGKPARRGWIDFKDYTFHPTLRAPLNEIRLGRRGEFLEQTSFLRIHNFTQPLAI